MSWEKNNLAGKGGILEGTKVHSVSPLLCRNSENYPNQCSLMLSKWHDCREVHGTLPPTKVRILRRLQGLPSLTRPLRPHASSFNRLPPTSLLTCRHLLALDTLLPPVVLLLKNTGGGLGLHAVAMAHHIVCTFIKMTHGQEAVGLWSGGDRGERYRWCGIGFDGEWGLGTGKWVSSSNPEGEIGAVGWNQWDY